MNHNDSLHLFTARFERGEISLETYRAELQKLCSLSDPKTQATIRRRLDALN